MKYSKGFTLLEILLVIAAISVLALIVIIAINPNRQLAQVRNSTRYSDTSALSDAFDQYLIENGSYPSGITSVYQELCAQDASDCTGYLDVRSDLVPQYIAEIPEDPSTSSENGTGYFIAINPDNNKVSVGATGAELEQLIAINALTDSLFDGGDNTWTPAEIATNLWLDAAATSSLTFPTLSVTGVQTWFDKSGNNRSASQSDVDSMPVITDGGLLFDGVDDFFEVDLDFLAGTDHQSYIVADVLGSHSNFYGATRGDQGNESLHVGFENASTYRVNFWSDDYWPSVTSNYNSGVSAINLLSYKWEAGVGKEVFANGYSEGSNTSAGNIGTMSDGGRILCVVSQGCMNVIIYEMIFVTGSNITTDNDERITGYLAHKWGLESKLPGTHPYVLAPPSGWTPSDITTDLWLDASDNSTFLGGEELDLVEQWNDLSGNDRHVTQSTLSDMPEYVDNSIVFQDETFLEANLDFLINDSHTSFFVIETPGAFQSLLYGGANDGSGNPHVGFSDGQYVPAGDYVINRWGNDANIAQTAAFQSGGTNIVQFEWLPGVSRSVWANGNLEGQDISGSTPAITTMPGGGRLVGVLPGSYPFMDVNIYEVVFLPGSELNQTNYDLITGYLAHKWEIQDQLPLAHPFRLEPPSSGVN
jgi:prepilin-type N-terminal cleavage/methylation domain-containing protein